MATVTEAHGRVDSLSASQVELLLRTIADHKTHLDVAHEDAVRLARVRLRPWYLIDFDLLYRFMFEYDEHVNWAQEFQFLLSSEETQYIVGPGTQTELVRLTERRPSRINAVDLERRLPELARLLHRPNVIAYEDLMGSMAVDEDAYEVALATLDRVRRARKEEANQADALNWAAVVRMRRHPPRKIVGGFPYLLTGTEPLLREEAYDAAMNAPISRAPGAAIYSQVLFDEYPEPTEAMRHTIEASFRAASIERDLRQSPAYLEPERHQGEPDLESALEEGRIGHTLREQLSTLSEFVRDPVAYSAQRVYDNVGLAAENLAQQQDRGRSPRVHESPRRLFDLIASLDAAMAIDEDQGSRGLGSLWTTVLDLSFVDRRDLLLYELRDRGGRKGKPAYFALEVHRADGVQPLFVMRWPGGLDAEQVLRAMARSFARHDESMIELVVGTSNEILRFEAELPIEVDEIVEAVADAHSDDAALGERGEFLWVRLNGEAFDLYADIAAQLPHDPVVGVFAPSMHPEHVTDLYQQSSARYLFAVWLQAALDHVRSAVAEQSHGNPESAI